jgi:hypothetical protein
MYEIFCFFYYFTIVHTVHAQIQEASHKDGLILSNTKQPLC